MPEYLPNHQADNLFYEEVLHFIERQNFGNGRYTLICEFEIDSDFFKPHLRVPYFADRKETTKPVTIILDELWTFRNKIDNRLQTKALPQGLSDFLMDILGNVDDLISSLED